MGSTRRKARMREMLAQRAEKEGYKLSKAQLRKIAKKRLLSRENKKKNRLSAFDMIAIALSCIK